MFKNFGASFLKWIVCIALCISNLWFSVSDWFITIGVDVEIPETKKEEILVNRDAMTDTYSAVDGLGRPVAMNDETGEYREDRFVGLFYWTWHVSHSKSVETPVNVNNVVTENPDASHDLDYSKWGYPTMPHHWNEPIYGFYDTDDRWVLRKQAELFAAAGVDVIIFDNTNGTFTWKESYDVLFEVFDEARKDGVNTPQIAFLLPFGNGENTTTQLRMLYEDIYSKGRYSNLWFYWKGKPLIMAYPDDLRTSTEKIDKEIYSFFTFRPGIAEYYLSSDDKKHGDNAFEKAFDRNQYWSWLSVYPQAKNYTRDGVLEQMAVSVAQNYCAETGLTAMNGENVFGRTYTSKGYDTSENAKLYGANFAEQCEYVLEADPEFVFITGWNEWVAGRFPEWQGVTNAFPDEFDDTYSRDIEPSKGDLKDHYYYQMVDFIRKYKGVRQNEPDKQKLTIESFSDWENVEKTYHSYAGNTFDRDDCGYGKIHYTDSSGRNDIVYSKVTSDTNNIYFLVSCKEPISSSSDSEWMRLLISTGDSDKSWEGYEYIINRVSPSGDRAVVEKSKGGWNWEKAGEAVIKIDSDKLMLAIPKTLLGIESDSFTVDFKWTDNTLKNGDIMDVYLCGDTAPTGRFNYRYICE